MGLGVISKNPLAALAKEESGNLLNFLDAGVPQIYSFIIRVRTSKISETQYAIAGTNYMDKLYRKIIGNLILKSHERSQVTVQTVL